MKALVSTKNEICGKFIMVGLGVKGKMKLRFILSISSLVMLFFGSTPARASALAFDEAGDAAYSGGWTNGSNGGFGWGGAWSFSEFSGGNYFTASSTTNGGGNIDTQGRSWAESTALNIEADQSASATRPFSGSLSVGQSFAIDMVNGIVTDSTFTSITGFQLGSQFQFFADTHLPGQGYSGYGIVDGNGVTGLAVSLTAEGLHIDFTLTSLTNYTISLFGISNNVPTGLPFSYSGSLSGAGTNVTSVIFQSYNTGPNPDDWNFFNSMAIIPEPGTLTMVALALPLILLLRRRRTSRS